MRPAPAYANPLFAPLRSWLDQLPAWPSTEALNRLLQSQPVFNASGQRICFVPPQADGLTYEWRIWAHGQVETRPDNWHDFFNALVWQSFTETKRAIIASHVQAMMPSGEARGRVRDALTHFDECGIVVLSSQPDLLDLMRNFAWKDLFVERRAAVISEMRFVVFGHATYEQLLKPFRGLTAKAILYEVAPAWLAMSSDQLRIAVDRRLATDLAGGQYQRPRDFQPLPLLGIPGVTPDNECPAYYDDTWQFRPGRRSGYAA